MLCLSVLASGVHGVGVLAGPTTSGSAEPSGGGDAFPEYEIKAAFLYNFIRYTTWPKESLGKKDEPIELLVIGNDPFGPLLNATFRGKKLHGRSVVIRNLKGVPKKLSAHLIFAVGLTKEQRLALIQACAKKPILLIGDESGFAKLGACANFLVQNNKVRFEFNTDATKVNRLAISSQLLKLATIVKTKEEKR